ncbi:glutathione peroxidase [Rhodovibrio sodomensis]|uniref:Glutathione peroxidase n=2 Tax=Rhodovibrio sodomensis TaxID=1088 RepID=A0ABS1DBQ3_9PROT|nr:glutathione peroxidase [Rhodovibrio sodomensis]
MLAVLPARQGAAADGAAASAHAFSFTSIAGAELDLSRYAGQPILLVNTASRCGYTDQYADLETLWDRYRDQGLVVIAVPSNDFRQELGSEQAVKQFCEATFDISFPMTGISHVSGQDAHPLYQWLGRKLGAQGRPRWNFHKVLIDPRGQPVGGWRSGVRPTDDAIVSRIERLLPSG